MTTLSINNNDNDDFIIIIFLYYFYKCADFERIIVYCIICARQLAILHSSAAVGIVL